MISIFVSFLTAHAPRAFASEFTPPNFTVAECARRLDLPVSPDLGEVRLDYTEHALSRLPALERTRSEVSRLVRQSVREAVARRDIPTGDRYRLFLNDEPAADLIVDLTWATAEGAVRIDDLTRVGAGDLPGVEQFASSALLRGTSLALTAAARGLAKMREARVSPALAEEALLNPIAPPVRAENMPGVVWAVGQTADHGLISLNISRPGRVARILSVHRASAVDRKIYLVRSGRAHGFREVLDGKLRGARLVCDPVVQTGLAAIGINSVLLVDLARSAPGVVFEQEFGCFQGRTGRRFFEVDVVQTEDGLWAVAGARPTTFAKFVRFEEMVRRLARGR